MKERDIYHSDAFSLSSIDKLFHPLSASIDLSNSSPSPKNCGVVLCIDLHSHIICIR